MYAYIKGQIVDISEDNLVLECNNIGYNIRIPLSVAQRLPGIGASVKIYTYTSVREDAFQLFGFLSKDDPGIGNKSAERIILELKDKVHLMSEAVLDAPVSAADVQSGSEALNEALEAMTALGYSPSEALKALRQVTVTDDMDSGAVLKQALKIISTM